LYMAKKVITTQGGAIIFSSEEGKGSTFGFIFPKDMPSGNVALPAQTRD
jgi:signal transduction histidine kinase